MTDPRTRRQKDAEEHTSDDDSLDRLDGLKSPMPSPATKVTSPYAPSAYSPSYYSAYYPSPYHTAYSPAFYSPYASAYHSAYAPAYHSAYSSAYHSAYSPAYHSHRASRYSSYQQPYRRSPRKYDSPQNFMSAIKRRETLVGKMYAGGGDVYEVCRNIQGKEECRFVDVHGRRVSRHRFRHV